MSDWDRITRLFSSARDLDPAGRNAFLDSACAGAPQERAELESLLANDHADSFLSRPASTSLARAFREVIELPEEGQILRGRYRLESRLAAGGQAIVYRATDQILSRPVVVKFLRAEAHHDIHLQARLRRETDALARIDHPGVVGILDYGELAGGSPFLVIQYIDGESLREALRNGPLEKRRTAAILRQIGATLSAAHALGITHRDLKPENIMIQRLSDGTETIKLIDFGLARIERSELDPAITTVMIAGTVRYMAPEQFNGVNGPSTDLYALALIVCEMLAGHPDLRALPQRINRRVRRALEVALAFRPEERPSNLRSWCDELAEALTTQTRRRFVAAAGGSAIVLAGGALAERWHAAQADAPRTIEYVAPFDPLTEGFRIYNEVDGTVVDDPARTSYEGWRVTTGRQGGYYHPLTGLQRRRALSRGWKLTADMRGEEGSIHAFVDFAGDGKRFDIKVIPQPDEDLIRLNTQIVPAPQGLEFSIPRKERAYRRYELVYDPGLGSAALWIDGARMPGKYGGHSQFQEDRGVTFGATIYGGPRGRGTFRLVRFEIVP